MTYHIITYGCQMNKNDSKRIKNLFELSGMKKASQEKSDFLIINACSVRGRVVDRIRGKLNNLSENKTLILTGCVLDKDKKELANRFDYVLDIKRLPFWHKQIKELKDLSVEGDYFKIKAEREKPVAYVPIMTGCDNFCSYCAVPYVRGREESRDPEDILKEIKELVRNGFKEIWLLGQNVNSYNKGNNPDFSDLLKKVNNLEGDFWIRFTSSHPKDFSQKLIEVMGESEKVTNYLNLPVQSGDNSILKKMNRPYTIERYKDIVEEVRNKIPEITLSTDIIVGFPGETRKAFESTKKLLQETKFDMAYIARYSPRPHTKASEMEDDVTNKEKKERAKELTDLLKKQALKKNKKRIGKEVKFLPTDYKDGFLIGKTKDYKTIKVKADKKHLNEFKKAKVTDATNFGLKGNLL